MEDSHAAQITLLNLRVAPTSTPIIEHDVSWNVS